MKNIKLLLTASFALLLSVSCTKKTTGNGSCTGPNCGQAYYPNNPNYNPNYIPPAYMPPSYPVGPGYSPPPNHCGFVPQIPNNHCWGSLDGYSYCGDKWYGQYEGGGYYSYGSQSYGCNGGGGVPIVYDYDYGHDQDYFFDPIEPSCSSPSIGNDDSGWHSLDDVNYNTADAIEVDVPYNQNYYLIYTGEYGQGTTGVTNVPVQQYERATILVNGTSAVINLPDLSDHVNTTTVSCYVPQKLCLNQGANRIDIKGPAQPNGATGVNSQASIHNVKLRISTQIPTDVTQACY